MNEIYWITRLDNIHLLSMICMVIGIIISGIITIIYYASNGQAIYDEAHGYVSSAEENKGYKNTAKEALKWCIPVTIIFCLLSLFVPTTKEALAIYGIGGTVDYIKQNPTARQLPDKCINALDKWVDSWTKENNKEFKE
jgi:heme/copper-type cytochrome/quinol oxidase subunit 2